MLLTCVLFAAAYFVRADDAPSAPTSHHYIGCFADKAKQRDLEERVSVGRVGGGRVCVRHVGGLALGRGGWAAAAACCCSAAPPHVLSGRPAERTERTGQQRIGGRGLD